MYWKSCLEILRECGDERELHNWSSLDRLDVRLVEVKRHELEMIENSFRRSCPRFLVTDVRRIESPYVMAEFLRKKHEVCLEFRTSAWHLKTRLLYHGTSSRCIERIARRNFDPKLCVEHKYGWGVSFSPDPYYASYYAAKRSGRTDHMEMILAHVITARCSLGKSRMTRPPPGCDTTRSRNGKVYVKYDAHSFYPAYKIEYVDRRAFGSGSTNSSYLSSSSRDSYDNSFGSDRSDGHKYLRSLNDGFSKDIKYYRDRIYGKWH